MTEGHEDVSLSDLQYMSNTIKEHQRVYKHFPLSLSGNFTPPSDKFKPQARRIFLVFSLFLFIFKGYNNFIVHLCVCVCVCVCACVDESDVFFPFLFLLRLEVQWLNLIYY